MPATSIFCGFLLIMIGVIGYVYGMMGSKASFTALIPAVFGIVFVILGLVSRSNEGLRKHLMHGAVALALLGFILTAGRVLMKLGDITLSAAVVSQLSMAAVTLAFVILGIRSFSAARRDKSQAGSDL